MVATVSTPQFKQRLAKRLQTLSRTRRTKRRDSISLAKSAKPSMENTLKHATRPSLFATLRSASTRYLGKSLQTRQNPFNTVPPIASSPRRKVIRVAALNFAPPETVDDEGFPTLRIRHPLEDFVCDVSESSSAIPVSSASSQVATDGHQSVSSDSPGELEAQTVTVPEENARQIVPAELNEVEVLATRASIYSLGSWVEINRHIDVLWVSNSVLEGLEEDLSASEDWSLDAAEPLPQDPVPTIAGHKDEQLSMHIAEDSLICRAVSELLL